MGQGKSLFDAFDIDIGAPVTDAPQPKPALSPLELMQEQDAAVALVRRTLPEAYTQYCNQLYLVRLAEKIQNSGKVCFHCARCWKPVENYKKLFLDKSAGLVYGTECAGRIRAKQAALKYHHRGPNVKVPAAPDELTTFSCSVWGTPFQGLAENVQHCGAITRSCPACPGTSVRNKDAPCDFERAVRALHATKSTPTSD